MKGSLENPNELTDENKEKKIKITYNLTTQPLLKFWDASC